MKRYIDDRGYTKINHEPLTFDQHCNAYPSTELARVGGVYIQKCYIPYTHEISTIVYFVSGSNGDEFGQFPTIKKAMLKLNEISKNKISKKD